jgi:hypothetical protein
MAMGTAGPDDRATGENRPIAGPIAGPMPGLIAGPIAADRGAFAVKPQDAAQTATDSLWTLHNLTSRDCYRRPSEAYAVIAELTLLARALPKVLARTASWLDTEHETGRLGCDDGQNVTLTVHASLLGLHEATRHARQLLRALNTAAEHAGRLTERRAP